MTKMKQLFEEEAPMQPDDVVILNAVISAGLGFLGVGVGVGVFKTTISNAVKDIELLKRRQAHIRGEDNGGIPKYVLGTSCAEHRGNCINVLTKQDKAIDALDNFARWWMQKEGLHIEDINKILNP
jgi:hypothetical protein